MCIVNGHIGANLLYQQGVTYTRKSTLAQLSTASRTAVTSIHSSQFSFTPCCTKEIKARRRAEENFSGVSKFHSKPKLFSVWSVALKTPLLCLKSPSLLPSCVFVPLSRHLSFFPSRSIDLHLIPREGLTPQHSILLKMINYKPHIYLLQFCCFSRFYCLCQSSFYRVTVFLSEPSHDFFCKTVLSIHKSVDVFFLEHRYCISRMGRPLCWLQFLFEFMYLADWWYSQK